MESKKHLAKLIAATLWFKSFYEEDWCFVSFILFCFKYRIPNYHEPIEKKKNTLLNVMKRFIFRNPKNYCVRVKGIVSRLDWCVNSWSHVRTGESNTWVICLECPLKWLFPLVKECHISNSWRKRTVGLSLKAYWHSSYI